MGQNVAVKLQTWILFHHNFHSNFSFTIVTVSIKYCGSSTLHKICNLDFYFLFELNSIYCHFQVENNCITRSRFIPSCRLNSLATASRRFVFVKDALSLTILMAALSDSAASASFLNARSRLRKNFKSSKETGLFSRISVTLLISIRSSPRFFSNSDIL